LQGGGFRLADAELAAVVPCLDEVGEAADVLELSVTFLGPSLAIYGVDIWLRRNRYDGLELHNETPGSRFWYWRGVNPAGVAAMIIGTAVALLCVSTSIYVSPAHRVWRAAR
jgi:cytosine/uracil/thiamine/allantoin permease